jgi:hypothetical protein
MAEEKPKSVDALGFRWTFAPNTNAEELTRNRLNRRAQEFLDTLNRPATRETAFDMFFPIYANVLSAIDKIEAIPESGVSPEQIDQLLTDLYYKPQVWFELTTQACMDNRASEIRELYNAARQQNPDWESIESPLKDAPPEVENAAALLEQTADAVTTGSGDGGVVEGEEALAAAGTVMGHVEGKAKKKGS